MQAFLRWKLHESRRNMSLNFLGQLNPAQRKAVEHPPHVPLQILAGPGSGKTKVLTSRIAYLILHHNLPPSAICAVTFTNKAANEMKERLERLIGKEKTNEVRMGTFHALCAAFLRKYGEVIGLEKNFTVCDADESKKIVAKLMKPFQDLLSEKNISLKEGTILSMISKAKAKGHGPDDMIAEAVKVRKEKASCTDAKVATATAQKGKMPNTGTVAPDGITLTVAEIYREYEKGLRKSNSLDFDDLLIYGARLFKRHDKAVLWCKHVLVDEFQDTNNMQYELMRHIASANKCVTVVGDPDQSIYGWRSAEVENLAKMQKDFRKTKQVLLEENYRSTKAILAASVCVVTQDKARIQKTIRTSHPDGPLPVLRSFPSEQEEAAFIAIEIKRVMSHMGGLLGWGDFAILLRFNALSRSIESALQKEAIPSRVLGGHKFFERLEIKDLLAYLQLVDNPQFVPAFSRAVNVPSRGIGEKTLTDVLGRAEKMGLSPVELIEKICDGKTPDTKPSIKRKAAPFIHLVRTLRELASKGCLPADLIRHLLDLIQYEDHLRKTQPDWESRWENVQELLNFASEMDTDAQQQFPSSQSSEAQSDSHDVAKDTPLRIFLQASMLSSEGDSKDTGKDKVTIATCHAAKGLEWPVVIVPAVEKGIFPFYRSDDLEEERRLLYVACTRAQGLLYLLYASKRKAAGETRTKELSEFISIMGKERQKLLSAQLPQLNDADRSTMAKVTSRPLPSNTEIQRRILQFNNVPRHQAHALQKGENTLEPPGPWIRREAAPENYVPCFQASSSYLNTTITSKNVSMHEKQKLSVGASVTSSRGTEPKPRKFSTLQSLTSTVASFQPNTTALRGRHVPIPLAVEPSSLPVSERTSSEGQDSHRPAPQPLASQPLNTDVSQEEVPSAAGGVKRRLGMGRTAVGYPSKKFKVPTG